MAKSFEEQVTEQLAEIEAKMLAKVSAQVEEAVGRKLTAPEMAGLKEDVASIKKALGRQGGAGGVAVETKTIGRLLLNSPDANLALNKRQNIKIRLDLKDGDYDAIMRKGLVTTTSDVGSLVDNVLRPGLIETKRFRPRMRDWIPVLPTNGNTVRNNRETALYELYTEVASTASSGQKNVVVDEVAGFFVGQAIKVGTESHVIASITAATKTLTTTVNLTANQAVDTAVTAEVFSFTSEANTKPQGKFKTEEVETVIKTLATGISPSKDILDDVPRLEATINLRLPQAIDRSEDYQIVKGGGTTDEFTGILNTVGISARNWSDGETGDTQADALRRGIGDVRTNGLMSATGIAVHPDDLVDLELLKDGENRLQNYVQILPDGSRRLWGLPVMECDVMTAGTALVGAWMEGAELYDRMVIDVEIFPQHSDYAAKNLVYIRAERRVGFFVRRPSAFCKVVFDSAP